MFTDRPSEYALLALALGAWVSLFFVAQDAYRLRARVDRRDVVLVALLFAVAFVVRWILPIHTFIHENKHGFVINPYLPLGDVAYSHPLLIKLYRYLTPLGREPIFELDVLLSALAVPGIFVLARQAFGSRLAGFSAAVFLLLQPLAILMAPTEEALVATTGLCLVGLPLVWAGVREELNAALVAGTCLVGLGAASREVTLPVASLAVLTAIAAAPPGQRRPLRRIVAVTLGLALALAPVALASLRSLRAARALPFVGVPHLPFDHSGADPGWVGWRAPYIPAWMAWLGIASLVALVATAIARPQRWREALMGAGTVVVAQITGGLVTGGFFTSALRHQLFAMALLALPAGWLIGQLERVRISAWMGAAAYAIAPVLGVWTLVARPDGYRFDAPLSQEYRFFSATIRTLPVAARAIVFSPDSPGVEQLPEAFFLTLQPAWEMAPVAELPELLRRHSSRPTYLFINRTCFLNRACEVDNRTCRSPEVRAAQPAVSTPYGRMHEHCAAALTAAPWREVARREITEMQDPTYDLPTIDPVVDVAVLRLDDQGSE